MANVGVAISGQTNAMTEEKFCFVAWILKEAGHDVMALVWEPEVGEACRKRQVPTLELTLEQVDCDVVVEAQKVHTLLDRQIENDAHAPTWGDLLAFDDFIGGAQAWEVNGMGGWMPDVIVQSNHGAESSTPTDEVMELALWRWGRMNNIPSIALEVQPLGGPLSITDYPHTITIKQAGMPPAHRHYCRKGHDPMLEKFLVDEEELRKKLNLERGEHSLIIPFHLYYMWEFMQTVQEVGEWKQQTGWDGKVFIPVGGATRRMFTENDLVIEGCKRWWQKIENIQTIHGIPLDMLALVGDGVVAKYEMSELRNLRERYGVNIWKGKGELRKVGWHHLVNAVKEVTRG